MPFLQNGMPTGPRHGPNNGELIKERVEEGLLLLIHRATFLFLEIPVDPLMGIHGRETQTYSLQNGMPTELRHGPNNGAQQAMISALESAKTITITYL